MLAKLRQFKVVPIDCDMINASLYDRLYGGVDLGDLGVRQSVSEVVGLSEVAASPNGQSLNCSLRHGRHE